MSIAILMISVVTKSQELNKKYPGGLKEYKKDPYVWHDDYLVGSSFMNGLDVKNHLDYLAGFNLCCGKDIAVVDQACGLLTSCDWLELSQDKNEQRIVWLKGMKPGLVIFPDELSDANLLK